MNESKMNLVQQILTHMLIMENKKEFGLSTLGLYVLHY